MRPFKAALIGYGYWGKNLARNLFLNKGFTLAHIADPDEGRLSEARELYTSTDCRQNYADFLQIKDIDLFLIATPVSTHFAIAQKLLENGKNILIEKPITSTASEAVKLKELSQKHGGRIFVDHTFLFTEAVRKIKSCVDANTLGTPYYYDSTRINLGLFHQDVNVILDLAPHDLSILDHLFGKLPVSLVAIPGNSFEKEMHASAYLHLEYGNNFKAHLNLSWLSPVKIRQTIVCGSEKMLLFDDMEATEKIRIYDKGVSFNAKDPGDVHRRKIAYRVGDIHIPKLAEKEALHEMLNHVRDCLVNSTEPINGVDQAIRVARVLDASLESLNNNGSRISLT